jgi:hypothetical protein
MQRLNSVVRAADGPTPLERDAAARGAADACCRLGFLRLVRPIGGGKRRNAPAINRLIQTDSYA